MAKTLAEEKIGPKDVGSDAVGRSLTASGRAGIDGLVEARSAAATAMLRKVATVADLVSRVTQHR